jgi:hypothetical protein
VTLRRSVQRLSTIVTLAAVFLVSTSAVAWAHECMVMNRSQNGEQAVGNSPMWLSENMATHESYTFVFEVVFGVTPTEEMLDRAVAMHIEQGLQEWAAFFQGHTLLTNPKTGGDTPAATKHSDDGKGVDHWSDTELGQAMIAIAASLLP